MNINDNIDRTKSISGGIILMLPQPLIQNVRPHLSNIESVVGLRIVKF